MAPPVQPLVVSGTKARIAAVASTGASSDLSCTKRRWISPVSRVTSTALPPELRESAPHKSPKWRVGMALFISFSIVNFAANVLPAEGPLSRVGGCWRTSQWWSGAERFQDADARGAVTSAKAALRCSSELFFFGFLGVADLPIVGGVALASLKELSFTWLGFWAAILSTLPVLWLNLLPALGGGAQRGHADHSLWIVLVVLVLA